MKSSMTVREIYSSDHDKAVAVNGESAGVQPAWEYAEASEAVAIPSIRAPADAGP
jgi:hypothetical protein